MFFNSYFAVQCTALVNNAQFPTRITTHSESVLTSIDFFFERFSNIMKQLYPNKAHGHDNVSVRIMKLCQDSINKPLETILRKCFNERIFPNGWKKCKCNTNSSKNDKEIVTNNSLFPSFNFAVKHLQCLV